MEKNKKKIVYGIIVYVICAIGVSYAYWNATYRQTGMNKLLSSCFNLALINEKNEINLQNQFPITDEEGMKTEPFQFTVENTCDLFASYTISLEVLGGGQPLNSKYIKAQINREAPIKLNEAELGTPTLSNSIESRILVKGSLGSGDKEDYTLRLWMDEDISIDDTESMNKTFIAKIVINGQPNTYSPVEQGITKLSDAMLANEYQTSVEAAKRKIAAKQAPNFAEVSPVITYQEVHEENGEVVVNVDKPHPSLNGNESLGGQNLDENSQKLIFGKSYSFKNTNPPSYTLEDRIEVDPTTIMDFQEKDYYFCSAMTSVDMKGIIYSINNYADCATIYKVNSISTTTSGTENTNTYHLRYVIRGYKYSSTEYESDKSEKGLYTADDDYTATTGEKSYYYRGSVNNNYVRFAGYYWRIIRRNGDSSVRLIYNGNKPDQTGRYTQIQELAFNTVKDNPAYVGYMYGNVLNTSYEQTHANENSSTMKIFLEDWYKTNIYDKDYHEYIADEIFCNDRSVTSGNGYTTDNNSYYGPYKRLGQSKNPTLICPQDNDKFTTTDAAVGNKELTYPIGLITADELSMAGAVTGKNNKLFYLYTGQWYWTMSPSPFYIGYNASYEWGLNGSGELSWPWVIYGGGVRAVLNLKPDVEITGGIGTVNDPFVVKENK